MIEEMNEMILYFKTFMVERKKIHCLTSVYFMYAHF